MAGEQQHVWRQTVLPRPNVDRGILLALWAGGLIGLAALFVWDPATSAVFPRCPFHALTGLHCPGCGTLRALHQLLHGNLLAALHANPLMVLSIPFLGYPLVSSLVALLSGRRLPQVFVPAAWIWVLLAIVILFWILRNIPSYPFCLLAP